MDLRARYEKVSEAIAHYSELVGRTPEEVCLVAVSKTVDERVIEKAVSVGITDLGENRPESLIEKQRAFPQPRWHFIGNIQSRRISDIVGSADLIHSVYQSHHLPKLDAAAEQQGKTQDILVEVNVSGEKSKAGLTPIEVEGFLEQAFKCRHLSVKGFMTMAPQGDINQAKICFDSLAQLRSDMKSHFSGSIDKHTLHELSMGMSDDWPQAIEAGATIVRIGRAIFDESFNEIFV